MLNPIEKFKSSILYLNSGLESLITYMHGPVLPLLAKMNGPEQTACSTKGSYYYETKVSTS